MNTTCGVFAGCWARAAKGDTAAAPHMSVMNSRRLMVTPTAQDNGIAATDTSTSKPGCLGVNRYRNKLPPACPLSLR
jgi:hypothetical protein